jgi:hypothetical protein
VCGRGGYGGVSGSPDVGVPRPKVTRIPRQAEHGTDVYLPPASVHHILGARWMGFSVFFFRGPAALHYIENTPGYL